MNSFDIKLLVAELKKRGLPVAEHMAEELSVAVFAWLNNGIMNHPSPYIKILLPVIAGLEAEAKKQIDKIDGQPG